MSCLCTKRTGGGPSTNFALTRKDRYTDVYHYSIFTFFVCCSPVGEIDIVGIRIFLRVFSSDHLSITVVECDETTHFEREFRKRFD